MVPIMAVDRVHAQQNRMPPLQPPTCLALGLAVEQLSPSPSPIRRAPLMTRVHLIPPLPRTRRLLPALTARELALVKTRNTAMVSNVIIIIYSYGDR